MKLKTQKRIAIPVAGVLVVGGIGLGISKLFSESSAPSTPSAPAVVRAPVTVVPPPIATTPAPTVQAPTTVAPPAVTQQKAGDNADEKARKLSMLQTADLRLLQGRGYTVKERLFPFGRHCNEDGTTDGTGYKGVATAISYNVSRGDVSGKICVEHTGKDGVNAKVGNFAAVAGSGYSAPVQAPVVVPAPRTPTTTIDPTAGWSEEKKRKLSDLQVADLQRLRGQGYIVNSRQLPFGHACNANGTTDGQGYKGTATSISYNVTLGGRNGLVCVSHSGKGGLNAVVTQFNPF